MDHGQRSVGRSDRIANSGQVAEAHRVVDRVARPDPAAAKLDHRDPHGARIDGGDHTGPIGCNGADDRRRRQMAVGVVDKIRRPAEGGGHAPEDVRSAAGGKRRGDLVLAVGGVGSQSGQRQQFPAERKGHRIEPRIHGFSGEKIDRIQDFNGVAGGPRQGLVHVGDQGAGGHAGAVGDRHQALRQRAGVLVGGHERAGAGLDVEHQAGEPGGELLGQDRGGNQRDRFDRRGHVADRVQALVGGRQIRRLADDGAAHLRHHRSQRRQIGLGAVTGDRIELVERPPGMAQAAPGDHRNPGATGRQRRRQQQRDVVADAAGGVLVERRAVQLRPVEDIAGIAHRLGEKYALFGRHAVEEDGHGESGDLAFGHRAVGQTFDQEGDLVAGEWAAVPLPSDNLLRQHHLVPRRRSCR